MVFTRPEPGHVIRYSYLWKAESARGQSEGSKDRPAAVILRIFEEDGRMLLYVAPITHSPPGSPHEGVELPAETKRRLGLDDGRSWVVTTELNRFVWPGPDLRPLSDGDVVYGSLPAPMQSAIADQIRKNREVGRLASVDRDAE